MSEFDFDELDRAVSSLMKKQTGDEPSASDSAQVVTTQSQTPDSVEPVPTLPTQSQSPEPIPAAATEPEAVSNVEDEPSEERKVTPQRRGKFMDVVASPAIGTPANRQPSRSGNTLQPVSRDVSSPAASPVPPRAVDGISQLPSTSASAQSNTDDTMSQSSWPDPIEQISEPDTGIDQSTNQSDSPAFEEIDTADVMKSPFLPDAKVEKRPLGERPEVKTDDVNVADSIDDSAPVDADQPTVEQPNDASGTSGADLPEELRDDVLSLDRDDTAELASSSTASTETGSVAGPVAAEPVAPVVPAAAVEQRPVEPVKPASNNALVGALPPRQSVQPPKDDDEPIKSIFDTDEHQPIKDHKKRSTGWFAVMIIGSMVVLGVIGGAIFYLLSNGY